MSQNVLCIMEFAMDTLICGKSISSQKCREILRSHLFLLLYLNYKHGFKEQCRQIRGDN